MKDKTLEISTSIQILKPVNEVFEAIADPSKMTNYFISKSNGRMEEGKQILWQFPEFEGEFPIRIGKIEINRYISYYWDSEGAETLVEISFGPGKKNGTVVTITEKEKINDEAGIKWLKGNTQGWANFLASLKAYLEYGINLRKGAFDFMSDKKEKKEYMFFIRKQGNSEEKLSPDKYLQFLKACEVYIETLKTEGKLISARPIAWSGKIISGKEESWKESSYKDQGEVIGGYYHILANNIEEAFSIAKANPEFVFNENTRIEVRPVKMEEETGFVYPSESE